MKLKKLFLPLVAIAVCVGLAACDDDDNNDQSYIESVENILVNGARSSGEIKFPGWLVAGYALQQDLGEVSEDVEENLPEGKYVSKLTPGIFTKTDGYISFNRNHSFEMYLPDGNGIETVKGTWNLDGRDYIMFDAAISGKIESVRANIVKIASNYILLDLVWPGQSVSACYELYWGEYGNEGEEKK